MKFELRHLEAFVAVAEELHFGRAASRLRIAQPALSQQILRLESALGADLLVRQRRRTTLSETGRIFLTEARRTLEQARVAETVAARAQRGELGRLRVGYNPTASSQHFLTALAAFERLNPDVDLSLRELPMGTLAEPLQDDTVDVAFVVSLGEFDCGAHEGALALRVLSSEGFVAAVAPTHPLAARQQIGLAELAEDTFVFLARDVCMYWFDQLLALCERAGLTPRANREVGELGTQLTLVAAGLGVALVQESTRLTRSDGIVYLPVREPTPPVASAVVWRADNNSPVLRHFLDVLPAQVDPVADSTSPRRRST
jgi:DNA-binding transcriptional LysR family regulator